MKRFFVLGHPIAHPYSPVMHEASFRAIGFEGTYGRLDVPPEQLGSELNRLRDSGCAGVNLTIPLKETAVPLMRELSSEAERFGAVNTVVFGSEGMTGCNTDADGFLTALREGLGRTALVGLKIAVIGCGGAGRTAAAVCRGAGAEVALYNRSEERLLKLADELGIGEKHSGSDDWTRSLPSADVVVNAAAVGIRKDDAVPVTAGMFRPGQFVFDMVIAPRSMSTPVLEVARAGGADGVNRIGMLVHQGARAFQIWTGLTADAGAMRRAVEQAILGN